MHVQWSVAVAGLVVGFVVGLTGMGGGALMTPILVLVFGVTPSAAISSDLVASFVMKPFGSLVHMRKGTVNWGLVRWLCIGSVPMAFAGVFLIKALGKHSETLVREALGVALLVAATTIVVKAFLQMRERVANRRRVAAGLAPLVRPSFGVKPLPTVLIGALGGLVVGMTSVGSGSLIIVLMLLLYPMLRANDLVGTDLVQAVPLVGAAALGHYLYGDFQFALTASLLVGAIPGVILGAQVSSAAPQGLIRRALVLVLLASALKLLNMSTTTLALVLASGLVVGPVVWGLIRVGHGLPWRGRPAAAPPDHLPGSAAGSGATAHGGAAATEPGLARPSDPSVHEPA